MIQFKIEKAKILQKIDVMVRKTMQMDMTWNWPCGVAYYGVCVAYAFTQNEAYLTALKKRSDKFILRRDAFALRMTGCFLHCR